MVLKVYIKYDRDSKDISEPEFFPFGPDQNFDSRVNAQNSEQQSHGFTFQSIQNNLWHAKSNHS